MTHLSSVALIAVVGGSGAGKGWLVERVCRLLGDQAVHLQLDDFYLDRSHLPMEERSRTNFDVPEAIDWEWTERVLRACRDGKPIAIPSYDFASHSRKYARVWTPRPFVLVDGLWLLHSPALRARFDLTIFLDTPTDVRCTRRLMRDVAKRGYTRDAIEQQLRTAVVPMHARYVEPQREVADLVLTHPWREPQLLELADWLWWLRSTAADVLAENRDAFRAQLLEMLLHHEYCN